MDDDVVGAELMPANASRRLQGTVGLEVAMTVATRSTTALGSMQAAFAQLTGNPSPFLAMLNAKLAAANKQLPTGFVMRTPQRIQVFVPVVLSTTRCRALLPGKASK